MRSEDHIPISTLGRLRTPHVWQGTVVALAFVLFNSIVRGRIIVLMILLILKLEVRLGLRILVSLAVYVLLIRV